jgi:predicted SAM-dependent methyltransferase
MHVNRRLYVTVRAVVRAVNTPIAKARLTRTLAKSARPLKIEVGGLKNRPGWVVTNVNAVTRQYLDATGRWPVEDGGASHVYSDNVIEHLPLAAGRAMFAEAYRCLRPGGLIRLVTPDIRRHVELYLAGAASVDGPEARAYRDLGLVVEHSVDLIRIPIGQFGHHEGYLYDLETLQLELERAGFHSVNRVQLGQSDDPVLIGLDTRADEGGAQFAVEAVR